MEGDGGGPSVTRGRHESRLKAWTTDDRICRDERLTVSVGSHPVSRGVLVDGPTLLVSLLADPPNSEEPTVVRCAVRLFVRRVLL